MDKIKDCVTTLPISPIDNPGLGLIIAPFLGDVFAKKLGIESVLSLNVNGTKLQKQNTEVHVSNYLATLELFGISPNFDCRDDDDEYLYWLNEFFSQLRSKGHIFRKKKIIINCDCGAVESLAEAENISPLRSLCYMRNSKKYCKLCNSELKEIEKYVFLFSFSKHDDFNCIYPLFYIKEIKAMAKKFEGRNFLISKSRPSALKICNKGEDIFLDVDFAWQMFLPVLRQCGYNPKILIGSNKNLMACYFSILIMRLIDQKNISLVIPPYYLAPRKKSLKDNEYCCEKILENHDVKAIRLFLASALNWRKKESILDFNLLKLISKMSYRVNSTKRIINLDGVFSELNDKQIKKLLAQIRKSRENFFVEEFFGLI